MTFLNNLWFEISLDSNASFGQIFLSEKFIFLWGILNQPLTLLGSLRNDDSDAVDIVGWKMNLHFIYESRDNHLVI